MGVNAGAFLGIMLCGYIGEKVSWSYGFGLAGIFMFLGMLQFLFTSKIFGDIGDKPEVQEKFGDTDISGYYILTGLILFLGLLASRIVRYPIQTRDRMIAIIIFAIMTVIFWMCFEQAGGSMTIFANSFTGRVMSDSWATIYVVANIIITVVPIAIITYVLFKLFQQTFSKYPLGNIFLGSSFVIIWAIVGWMINRDLNSNALVVDIPQITMNDDKVNVTENMTADASKITTIERTIIEPINLSIGDEIELTEVRGKYLYLNEEKASRARELTSSAGKDSPIIKATVKRIKENEVEIPATWFGILNSLFIIMFAPLFSKWWESKYNPSAATKYGLGLILLGIGFAALAFGSMTIPSGAEVASVSIIWLILAYLFHTLGELCLSPVALSYISKLVPGRMIALMFGVWYIAVASGNKLAGLLGGSIEEITAEYSMTTFFLIFTIVPIGLGLLGIALNPVIKKLMHGVK